MFNFPLYDTITNLSLSLREGCVEGFYIDEFDFVNSAFRCQPRENDIINWLK